MMDGGDALTIRTRGTIAEIGREVWNGLADTRHQTHPRRHAASRRDTSPASRGRKSAAAFPPPRSGGGGERSEPEGGNPPHWPPNPFVSYDFLSALEQSKSVGRDAGWLPAHLVVEEAGRTVAAAPLYLKSHSQGEYVFDHHWADAYERAGGRYYPKLVCASPFSPVLGPRLVACNPSYGSALAKGLIEAARAFNASSIHVNFIRSHEEPALLDAGFLPRRGVQYHWFNRGYRSFDDFLGALASRKRKAIRRERAAVAASGVRVRRLEGAEIKPAHWDAIWNFYQDTGSRKWGCPYLTREFFRIIAETMADRLMLVIAERDGQPIAGALNFIGGDALYGRYWGHRDYVPFLHFELCYHQAIEFAIERSLARVEAGAQGEHKIARGYEPVETFSAHWIADPAFRRAIESYLEGERAQIAAAIATLAQESPFRTDGHRCPPS